MRLYAPTLYPSRCSNERGQFVPLTAMVLFSAMMLFVAGINIYRVAKAKLMTQNMADAAALAIAGLQAKAINVVVDRDEWLNHMYADNAPKNNNQLPPISKADTSWNKPKAYAVDYAQLVYTINKAQMMFAQAYDRFMGADGGNSQVSGQNSGLASITEILHEIDGLNDPSVSVVVYNTGDASQDAQQMAQSNAQNNQKSSQASAGSNVSILTGALAPIPFKTEPVTVKADGKAMKLKDLLGLSPDDPEVGWMHPDWDNQQNTMSVPGQSKKVIGVGVVVVKTVPLLLPLVQPMAVTARATAYVVQSSGQSMASNASGSSSGTPAPPPHFRPTYYVKLGMPS